MRVLIIPLFASLAFAQTGAVNVVGGVVDLTPVATRVAPIGAAALGTDSSGNLISVTPGGGTTPGYPGNQITSGLGVEYLSALNFTVGTGNYLIGGVAYSIAALTPVTLSPADMTNPRIDVIYVDNNNSVHVLTGTPAMTPAQPTVDYSTQLPLNLVLVPAGSSTPGGISATLIYDENVEWTSTCSTNLNCASTNNPYSGTKDIEATAAVLGNSVTLVKPAAGTVNLQTQNTLIFYIRSKAKWPSGNGTGSNGLRTLSLFWLNGSTQVGLQVVLKDGAFGFSSSITTTYQQIAIPIQLFGTGSSLVTTLKAQVTGNGGTSSFGWYLDEITLQSGQAPLTLPATLMNFKGTWNSTANYNANDTVFSGGLYYVALVANTNVAVGTVGTWTTPSPGGVTSVNGQTGAVTNVFQGYADPIYAYHAAGVVTTTTGSANTGAPTALTLGSGTGWTSGMGIAIAGAGAAGAELVTSCTTVVGTACTLATGVSTNVSGATVYHDDTAAIASAIASGLNVHLRQGSYNVTCPTAATIFTISSPVSIIGDGQGLTFINKRCAAQKTFAVSYSLAYPASSNLVAATISDIGFTQDTAVTATAGSSFYVATGSGNVVGLLLRRLTFNLGVYAGVETGPGAFQDWFEDLNCVTLVSDCIISNTATPQGDLWWDNIVTNTTVGGTSNIRISQADTQAFTNLKINGGAQLLVAVTSGKIIENVRFINLSLENAAGSATATGGTITGLQFVGGNFGFHSSFTSTGVKGLSITGMTIAGTAGIVVVGGTCEITGNNFDMIGVGVSLTTSASCTITGNNVHQDYNPSGGTYFVQTDSSITSGLVVADNVSTLGNNFDAATLAAAANWIVVNGVILTPTVLTHATGLPVSTGVSGLGTGVATALAANVSGAGAICLATGSACSGGGGGSAGATLFSTTNSTTVTATSPTTLIGTITGSNTIAANTFTAGQVLQVVAQGYYTTPATPASLTITLNIGGTIRITTGAVVQIASVTNGVWNLQCSVTTRTTGASGTQIANCIFVGTGATLTPGEAPMQVSSAWTIDTTATQVVDLVATWSTATGSPTITSTNIAAWIPGAPVTSVNGNTGAVATPSVQSVNLGTQTGGTSARVLGTVYQNTNSYPIFVSFACIYSGANTQFQAQTDSNSSPSQIVSATQSTSGASNFWLGLPGFWVIPGNYYSITAGAGGCGTGASGSWWTEWH